MFKCEWYDTEGKGIKVDNHGLVEILHKKYLQTNDPFVLAVQAQQVYYSTTPSRKRERSDWWNVIKTKSRRFVDQQPSVMEDFYQEDEEEYEPILLTIDLELDQDGLLAATGLGEEVDPNDLHTTINEEDFIDDEDDDIEDDELEFESSSSGEEMEFDF